MYAVLFTPFVVVVASLGDYFGIGIASLLLRILFTSEVFSYGALFFSLILSRFVFFAYDEGLLHVSVCVSGAGIDCAGVELVLNLVLLCCRHV